MGPPAKSSAAWTLPAERTAVGQPPRQAVEFASAVGASDEVTNVMALAVSEAVRGARALPLFGEDALERLQVAARECVNATQTGNVMAELEASRRFHFAHLESPDPPHTVRVIGLLSNSTEVYRAMSYNSPERPPRGRDNRQGVC